MAKDSDKILQQVVEIMRKHSEVSADLTMETHIAADLALDSVAMFELMMDVEEHFDVDFSIEEGSSLNTVGSLVTAISNKSAS